MFPIELHILKPISTFYAGEPIRFRIFDTRGNRPFIKIRQDPNKRVTHEAANNNLKLKASDGSVLVEIQVTAYETDVDEVNE